MLKRQISTGNTNFMHEKASVMSLTQSKNNNKPRLKSCETSEVKKYFKDCFLLGKHK